jgi:hypothetical protein
MPDKEKKQTAYIEVCFPALAIDIPFLFKELTLRCKGKRIIISSYMLFSEKMNILGIQNLHWVFI